MRYRSGMQTSFTRMVDATPEDYAVIGRHALGFQPERPPQLASATRPDEEPSNYEVRRQDQQVQGIGGRHADGLDGQRMPIQGVGLIAPGGEQRGVPDKDTDAHTQERDADGKEAVAAPFLEHPVRPSQHEQSPGDHHRRGHNGRRERALELLRAQLSESGANYLVCRFAFGDLSLSESTRSLELFQRHVMPGLRESVPVAAE